MASTIFVLAGEASGDLHGGKLIAAFKQLDPTLRFVGMGGPRMAAAGLDVTKNLDGMQVMGFWEVAKQYGFFRDVFYKLLDRLKQERPAALVAIDYPGFNLRFAREVRKLGVPCLYYIVPQVWAWKPKRAARMAEFIDRAYCLFDFEPPFFEKFRSPKRPMKTFFVGHPLLDDDGARMAEGGWKRPPGRKTVAFLPGSRAHEFQFHHAIMECAYRKAAARFPGLRGLSSVPPCASAHGAPPPKAGEARPAVAVLGDDAAASKQALANCDAGSLSHASLLPALADFSVVKSGTSALEAGLQGNPMCVVYRAGWISSSIGRLLAEIPVMSLVNIVLGRYAVPELLQGEVTPARIAAEIERGLSDPAFIERQRAALAELPGKLGGPGASRRAAQAMLDFLHGKE